MGGDGLDQRVFATIDRVRDHGGDQWWLYVARCSACDQHWMVAQEERIFDEYFMQRITSEQAAATATGNWPDDFITYERVLRIGRAMSSPCVFLNRYDPSLVSTAHDLRHDRPEITIDEIAHLLGVSSRDAAKLLIMQP